MDRRQTQENIKEKVVSQPSSRISRLAQPRKYSATPRSLNRNRSSSQENILHYNRPTHTRSRSAAPSETPIRAPIARSLSSLFTPASTNRSRVSTNRTTASTNRSTRKPDNEHAARILQVLRNNFGPTFLSGGLQSMSAKQFVEIIKFFADTITGGKVVIQNNNVDDVKHFVDYMEYPHQMNKSWFKAPTVSIAYERNVEFLDWLCDLVVGDDGNDEEYKYTESDSLIDQQFVASFVGDLKNGFAIWSEDTAEFDGWKLKWIREMIHSKTGLDDIDASIGRIQNEYAILQTKEVPFDNENLLQSQQRKLDDLKNQVVALQVVCQEKNMDLEATAEEVNSLTSKNDELTSAVERMKETIKNQPVSAEGRQKIIADYECKKHLHDEESAFVNMLKAISVESQLKIARLTKQKTSQIFAINAAVHKMFKTGVKFGDITVDQLSINEKDTVPELKAKFVLFDQVREIINTRRADICALVKETQSQLTSISNELSVVEGEVSGLKKHLHSLEIRLRKMENEIGETQYESERQQKQLQVMIDKRTEEVQKIQLKIQNYEQLIETLKAENKSIFEGIQSKSDALLKAKLERQARREAAIAELEKVTDRLKDTVKHFRK